MLNFRECIDLSSHVSYLEQAIIYHAKILVLPFVPQALVILNSVLPFIMWRVFNFFAFNFNVPAICTGASRMLGWFSQPLFVSMLLSHILILFSSTCGLSPLMLFKPSLSNRTRECFPLANEAQPFPAVLPENPAPAVRKSCCFDGWSA